MHIELWLDKTSASERSYIVSLEDGASTTLASFPTTTAGYRDAIKTAQQEAKQRGLPLEIAD